MLAAALHSANGQFLGNDRSPSRKVGELDNRGSHFYLALYWAQALAAQSDDGELQAAFTALAQTLADNEDQIVDELNNAQGVAEDIGGYYHPDYATITKAMRPSATFNAALDSLG